MERFEMPNTDPEGERVAKLADAAQAFAKTYEEPHHIYKALDQAGIRDLGERKRLLAEIRKELHRRTPKPLSERKDLIEDARRQEARHPKEEDEN
ncbi:MAG TPA: hypothetical protein VL283_00685 [Candidatus Baltobacteraceae bacterium]|jgi:hypothetical protein|nr:hypothetical protein [Candidatus Baltobacteraceae bacterium]